MNYNRDWLRSQIVGYLHDDTVTALLDSWIDVGAKRVSQVLECWEMETFIINTLVVVLVSGVFDGGFSQGGALVALDGGDAFNDDPDSRPSDHLVITGDIRKVIGVQVWEQGQWINLTALSQHDSTAFKLSNAGKGYYLIENRNIWPLPFAPGDYRALVLKEVLIPPGNNQVDALTSYPFVFLNAALAEAYDWKQNPDMVSRYEGKWIQEAEKVAGRYRAERQGETLAMRAV